MRRSALVSFLGRTSADRRTGYRTATYAFDDGRTRTVPFFGLALREYLQPDRLVVLGTAGSMWSVFVEHAAEGADLQDLRLRLMEAAESRAVDADMLAPLEPWLERRWGVRVALVLIPYGRSPQEQIDILRAMADAVDPGDRVYLDVSHGFRHLPMLALAGALYLEHVRQVTVAALYYGALDMTGSGEATPVLNLSGLLGLLRWVQALARYDADGNYGAFASLLQAEGLGADVADALRNAAFFERTGNPVQARHALHAVEAGVRELSSATGALFKPELLARIDWFHAKDRHEWELRLADAYLERCDYMRAAMFLQEAYLSLTVARDGGRTSEFAARELARQDMLSAEHEHRQERRRQERKLTGAAPRRQAAGRYSELSQIRNAMAHGVRGKSKIRNKALRTEAELRDVLIKLRRELFRS